MDMSYTQREIAQHHVLYILDFIC